MTQMNSGSQLELSLPFPLHPGFNPAHNLPMLEFLPPPTPHSTQKGLLTAHQPSVHPSTMKSPPGPEGSSSWSSVARGLWPGGGSPIGPCVQVPHRKFSNTSLFSPPPTVIAFLLLSSTSAASFPYPPVPHYSCPSLPSLLF